MENFTFAFITPSYAPDFQRCKLLCWSIKKFVSSPIKHYIIIDRQDFNLFQELADVNIIILIKEDILPDWIKRLPFLSKKNIWFNFKGFETGEWLIRGWLIQQIIKLAAAQYAEEEVLVFVDSDVAFIDTFDVHELVKADENQVRLFRVRDAFSVENKFTRRWKQTAKVLLNLPKEKEYHDNYVSQIITWRRNTLLELYKAIEKQSGIGWMQTLTRVQDLSEYVLYGIFVNYVLKDKAGHYEDHTGKLCYCHWSPEGMSPEALANFFENAVSSSHKSVMISAKSPVELSIAQFQQLLEASKQSGNSITA